MEHKLVDHKGTKVVFLKEELGDYELDDLPPNTVLAVIYYEEGDYCGSGNMISVHESGKIFLNSLSHCSCYGPMHDLNFTYGWYEHLWDIITSDQYGEELEPIFSWFRKAGKLSCEKN